MTMHVLVDACGEFRLDLKVREQVEREARQIAASEDTTSKPVTPRAALTGAPPSARAIRATWENSMQQATKCALAGDAKVLLAGFCSMARAEGTAAAIQAATVQLVAAAAYLEEVAGRAKTRRILIATIQIIDPETPGIH